MQFFGNGGYSNSLRAVLGLSIAIAVAMLMPAFIAAAEADPAPEIVGDRPDYTESAVTIASSHLQGEVGLDYSTLGGDKVLTIPNLLLRYGVGDNLEVRFGVPSLNVVYVGSRTLSEPGSLELGLKATSGWGRRGRVGLLPFVELPVKSEQWSGSGVGVGLKALWSVDFTDDVGLGGNVGVVFEGVTPASAEPMTTYLASTSLGFTLNERLGAFTELYGLEDGGAKVGLVADGGFTYLVAPWLQFDLYFGTGLTPPTSGIDIGFGGVFLL